MEQMQSFSMEYENSSRRALASTVHSVFGLGPQTSMEFGNIAVINRNKRVNYLNFAMVFVLLFVLACALSLSFRSGRRSLGGLEKDDQ